MKIYPDKLPARLAQHQDLFYLVSGDETLLVNEAVDAIRQAAKKRGYLERETHDTDLPGFSWESVLQSLNSLSLFADKKLLEIRASRKHLGDDLFLRYWENPNPDTMILVITDKIDKKTQDSKWFRTLDEAGVVITIWPLEAEAFHRWLGQRCVQQGLQLDAEALRILQERTEGNLLAAMQELEKLHLQFGKAPINAEMLEAAVADNSRHNVFSLVDQLLAGHAEESLKIFHALMEEGGAEFMVQRQLQRELHILANTREALDQGQPASTALQRQGVWDKRQPAYLAALKRLNQKTLEFALQKAGLIDLACMGLAQANARDELENLCLLIAGKPSPLVPVKRSR